MMNVTNKLHMKVDTLGVLERAVMEHKRSDPSIPDPGNTGVGKCGDSSHRTVGLIDLMMKKLHFPFRNAAFCFVKKQSSGGITYV